MVSIISALSTRILSQSSAVGWSYSGKLYRLKRRLASSTRRLISAARSAFSHTVAPRYTDSVARLYTWPTASVDSNESDPVRTFRHHAHDLRLGFQTINPNEPRTATTVCHHLCKAVPRSGNRNDARVVCVQHSPDRLRPRPSLLGFISPFLRPPSLPPPSPFSSHISENTISFTTSALALNRSTATRSTAVKNMLNNNDASTHPYRRPCPTPNQSEYSPSSVRDARTHSIVDVASNIEHL